MPRPQAAATFTGSAGCAASDQPTSPTVRPLLCAVSFSAVGADESRNRLAAGRAFEVLDSISDGKLCLAQSVLVGSVEMKCSAVVCSWPDDSSFNGGLTQHIVSRLLATSRDIPPPHVLINLDVRCTEIPERDDDDAQAASGGGNVRALAENQGWEVLKDSLRTDALAALPEAAAGTDFALARDAIMSWKPQFNLHDLTVEQEKVGKLDASNGKLALRTLSYILVPLMCAAIVGIEDCAKYFPAFPVSVDGCGRDFAFDDAVSAVRTILNGKIKPNDIQLHPKGRGTLYFDRELQDFVINAMDSRFNELWTSMQKWIQTRFANEVREHDDGGSTLHASIPVATAPLAGGPVTAAAGGDGGAATAATSAPSTKGASTPTPVDSTSAPAATSTGPSLSDHDENLLLEACQAVRLPICRVRTGSIQQHNPSPEALHNFTGKGFELALAALAPGTTSSDKLSLTFINPAGHSWVLLAVPGSDEAVQLRNAACILRGEFSVFAAADTLAQAQAGHPPNQRTTVLLAGDQYHGAGILSRALLGSGQSPYDQSAPDGGAATVTAEPDFLIASPRDACQRVFSGVFKSSHQLLPIFSVYINAWGASAPGSAAQQGDDRLSDAAGRFLLLAPVTQSSLQLRQQIMIWKLRTQNDRQRQELKERNKQIALAKERSRDESRRRKRREDATILGCRRVTLAAEQPRVCGMESISLNEGCETADSGAGQQDGPEKKRKCIRGTMGIETIVFKMEGCKGSRKVHGSKPGGLAWRDGIMACSVMTFSLFKVSFKTGGAMCFSWLRSIQQEVYIKAEALGRYKSRRLKPESLHHIFQDISPRSMRRGVHSMNIAKNSWMIDELNRAHAIAFSGDLTSVSEWTVQGIHIRVFRVLWKGKTDAAGTRIMEVDCLSWVVDVFAVGDKLVQQRRLQEADGTWKELPIEVPTCFATQLMYSGALWAMMRCRGLSATFDGGNEAVGAGNRERARETMCGENSILQLVWMLMTAVDSAFESLNDDHGLFVPLMDMYGFDWEKGDFLERKPVDNRVDTVDKLLRDAVSNMNRIVVESSTTVNPSPALVDLTGDTEVASKLESLIVDLTRDSEDDETDPELRATPAVDDRAAPRPIYDPLSSIQHDEKCTFYDFVVRDMAEAYGFLNLPRTVHELTEAKVEAVEAFVTTLINSAQVLDARRMIITEASWKALLPNQMMHDDAVTFMLRPMTHAMGGRLLTGSGRCTTEPSSPLIEVDVSQDLLVIDSILTGYLESKVNEASPQQQAAEQQAAEQQAAIKKMTRVFRAREGRRNVGATVGEMVEIGPDTVVIAATHLPNHFVTTEMEHLAQLEKNVAITRADSFCVMSSIDHFYGKAHDALRVAFRALKLIRETQKVDLFGLALPLQDRPDCALYMLTRLAARLTGKYLRSDLWSIFTRLLRCYTGCLVYRSHRHVDAISDVWDTTLSSWAQQQAQHTDNSSAGIAAGTPNETGTLGSMPQPTLLATKDAEDAMWGRAIAGREAHVQERTAQRRNAKDTMKALLLEVQLKAAAGRAKAAWKPKKRAMPKQLPTDGPVHVCNTLPIRFNHECKDSSNQDVEDRKTKWKKEYEQRDRISMHRNPCRYFIMAEEDGTNSNLKAGWCGRHCSHCCAQMAAVRMDCFPSICEETINFVRNSFFHRRAVKHAAAYVAVQGDGKNRVRADKINTAASKAMKEQIDSWGPLSGKMKIMADGSTAPSSYYDVIRTEIKKRGFLRKPRVCAKTRWGTRFAGKAWMHLYARLYSALTIHIYGQSSEQQMAHEAASVFHESGFKDGKKLRFPPAVGRHMYFLNSQKDILYLAFGKMVNTLFVKPVLAAFSRDNECACASVCGLGSIIRKLLRFLRSELFVGKFNIADSITGSNQAVNPLILYKNRYSTFNGTSALFDARRKNDPKKNRPEQIVTLAHRSVSSLTAAYRRGFFLINPRANVRKCFGPFSSEDMDSCVPDLLGTMRRIAGMEGEIELYPTLEEQWIHDMSTRPGYAPGSNWAEVVAKGKSRPLAGSVEAEAKARFFRNMHKMQWAWGQLVMDLEAALLKWYDHELFSLMGFVGCTTMRRSVKALDTATDTIVDVMIAHEDAVACGVIASRMIDELVARYPGEDFPRFLPSQLTDLLSSSTLMEEFRQFCLGHDIEGFHLVDAEGRVLKDKNDTTVVAGPAPAERYPKYAFQAIVIRLFQTGSNDIERVFNPVADGFRRGGRYVGPLTISVWCRRNDWVSAGLWGKEKDPIFLKVFGVARRFFARFESRIRNMVLPDTLSSEQRKMCARLEDLPIRNRDGQAFTTSNIVPNKKAFRFGAAREDDSRGDDQMTEKPQAKRKATRGGVLVQILQKAREVRANSAKKGAPGLKKRVPLKRAQNGNIGKRRKLARSVEVKSASVNAGGGGARNQAEAAELDARNQDFPTDAEMDQQDIESDGAHAVKEKTPSPLVNVNLEAQKATNAAVPVATKTGVSAIQSGNKRKHSAEGGSNHSDSNAQPRKDSEEPKEGSGGGDALSVAGNAGDESDDAVRDSATRTDAKGEWVHPMLATFQEWSKTHSPTRAGTEWVPATVNKPAPRAKNIFLTRCDGKNVSVPRGQESGCTAYIFYDRDTSEVFPVQIKCLFELSGEWKINYCRIYSTTEAIRAADRDKDAEYTKKLGDGQTISMTLRGSDFLRNVLSSSKHEYHIGDCHWKKADLSNIIGVMAWTPASVQLGTKKDQQDDTKRLIHDLVKLGLDRNVANELARQPLYIGAHFSETKSDDREYDSLEDEGSESSDSSANEGAGLSEQLPMSNPSRRQSQEYKKQVFARCEFSTNNASGSDSSGDSGEGESQDGSSQLESESDCLDTPVICRRDHRGGGGTGGADLLHADCSKQGKSGGGCGGGRGGGRGRGRQDNGARRSAPLAAAAASATAAAAAQAGGDESATRGSSGRGHRVNEKSRSKAAGSKAAGSQGAKARGCGRGGGRGGGGGTGASRSDLDEPLDDNRPLILGSRRADGSGGGGTTVAAGARGVVAAAAAAAGGGGRGWGRRR